MAFIATSNKLNSMIKKINHIKRVSTLNIGYLFIPKKNYLNMGAIKLPNFQKNWCCNIS